MKKWTIVGLTTLLTLAASAALASVPQKSLYLGGIGIGSEGSYIRQIYGAPTETEREHSASHPSGSVVEYEYGDGVSIHLAEGAVYHMEVSANNGWATPEGIHVGMDASLLEGTYGKPDMVRGDKSIYRAEGLPVREDRSPVARRVIVLPATAVTKRIDLLVKMSHLPLFLPDHR